MFVFLLLFLLLVETESLLQVPAIRKFVSSLAKAAVAVGVAGVFMETHPDPDKALSDGPNSMKLTDMPQLLQQLSDLDQLVKRQALHA